MIYDIMAVLAFAISVFLLIQHFKNNPEIKRNSNILRDSKETL